MADGPSLVVEPVIGFRTWLLTEDHQLRSVVKHHHWNGQPAVCDEPFVAPYKRVAGSHEVPHEQCQCGYWLLDTYPRLQKTPVVWFGVQIRSVRGVAMGWGRTVVCEHGWRVQYAKPMALLAWPERSANATQEEAASYWNQVCEDTAQAFELPLLADGDELTAHAEGLRERALTGDG